MPCLNEAETLATCIRKAQKFLSESGVLGEVLIADNGSTDGSQLIAEEMGARVVPIPRRGYGAALIGGIEDANGRFVIMGDADDSYDFSKLMPYVERLRAGADLVMGNRFKGGIAPGAMPFLHKYLGNPVLSYLGRLFFRIPVRDFHCGLRGFNRAAILGLNLTTPGMEFASEMVVKSALAGLRVEEVPTTLSKDGRSRPPHLRTWRDGWRHLRFLLIFSPKYLYFFPGIVFSLIGLAGLIWTYRGPVHLADRVVLDIHTYTAFVFCFVLGAQFLLFGVVARKLSGLYGIRPADKRLVSRGVEHFATLEYSLLFAGLGFLGGVMGAVWCGLVWQQSEFAPMAYGELLRPFLLSMAAMVISIQALAAFFFSAAIQEYEVHRIK